MIDRIGEREFEFTRPCLARLPRSRIDQIKGEARKNIAREADGFQGFFGCVQTPEEFQLLIVERLHA